MKTPIEERTCDCCKTIEDEFHYVMVCEKFSTPRKKLLQEMSEIFVNFESLSPEEKFIFLMKCEDFETVSLVLNYMNETVAIRGPL